MTALEELVTIASMESRTCYAAELGDCAGPLTREHAVSQAILERLNTNGKLVVARSGEVPKSLPPKALAARVLCERHNNALSAVDDEAKRFFDAVDAAADLGARRGRGDDVLVDGVLIERWMLKSLAGAIAAGDVATPEGVEVPRIVPTHWLPFLFGRQRQTATCGLHLFDDGGAPWHGYRHVSRTPLFAPGDIVVGVTMDIGPLHLHYIAEPPPGPRHPRLHRRPRRFKFRHQRSNARWDLRLSWIPPSDGGTFDVSISDE